MENPNLKWMKTRGTPISTTIGKPTSQAERSFAEDFPVTRSKAILMKTLKAGYDIPINPPIVYLNWRYLAPEKEKNTCLVSEMPIDLEITRENQPPSEFVITKFKVYWHTGHSIASDT